MEITTEQRPPQTPDHDEPARHVAPALKAVVVVGSVVVLSLGGALAYEALTADDAIRAVPADVEEVLRDFMTAIENNDYTALQRVVTEDFRGPRYGVHPDGTGEYRRVEDIEDFDFLGAPGAPEFSIDTVGAPVVRGEGPWIVAVRQDWEQVGTGTKYEGIQTFVIVDTGVTLQVEDAYWAGIGPLLVAG